LGASVGEDDALDHGARVTGIAAVHVLELALPAAAEADEAPHQAYLTDLDGEDLGAGP
jgi:hypothetical protein